MESSGREIDDIIDLDQFNYALDQSSWLMVGDRIFDEYFLHHFTPLIFF